MRSAISDRVSDAGFPEAPLPKKTGITGAAGNTLCRGVIAGSRELELEGEIRCPLHDLGLGHLQERRADLEGKRALHTGARAEVGHPLEGFEELQPAVGVAGVVESVGSDEDRGGADRLAPRAR